MENSLGPAPVPVGPARPLSGARAAVLDALRSHADPCTVDTLADELAAHTNTVREHLEALVEAGLVRHAAAPAAEGRGARRGRPARHYEAVEDAGPQSGYAALAATLAAQLSRLAPDPAAAGRESGRAWARESLGSSPEPVSEDEARRRVLTELADLGFGVGPAESPDAVRLVSCPLLAAAREQPDVVCSVHAGLVEESLRLLGHAELAARLEPFAEPGACRLTIRRPGDAP